MMINKKHIFLKAFGRTFSLLSSKSKNKTVNFFVYFFSNGPPLRFPPKIGQKIKVFLIKKCPQQHKCTVNLPTKPPSKVQKSVWLHSY